MKHTMKKISAAGMEGFLLIYPDFSTAVETDRIAPTGAKVVECKDWIVAFRVYEYDENGKHKNDEDGRTVFKDYEIRHQDLKIKLLSGFLYETEEGDCYLDY